MFQNIGFSEIILIGIVALIIFGPQKLPEIGRVLGRTINEFKKSTRELLSDEPSAASGKVKSAAEESLPGSAAADAGARESLSNLSVADEVAGESHSNLSAATAASQEILSHPIMPEKAVASTLQTEQTSGHDDVQTGDADGRSDVHAGIQANVQGSAAAPVEMRSGSGDELPQQSRDADGPSLRSGSPEPPRDRDVSHLPRTILGGDKRLPD